MEGGHFWKNKRKKKRKEKKKRGASVSHRGLVSLGFFFGGGGGLPTDYSGTLAATGRKLGSCIGSNSDCKRLTAQWKDHKEDG